MRRHDKRKLENDRRVDRLLQSEYGRSSYWEILLQAGRKDSMISLLESTLHLPGDVIECGVYRGNSFQLICRAVAETSPDKRIYACDSFEGFPKKKVGRIDLGTHWILSRVRRKYRLCQDTPARLERFFESFNVNGQIVKGFFSETLERFSNEQFCFIHLDCDLYVSYGQCLELLYHTLVPGGVFVFDDYGSPNWPGAKEAVDEFFSSKKESVCLCEDLPIPSWYVRKPQ